MKSLLFAVALTLLIPTTPARAQTWTGSWATAPVAAPANDTIGPQGTTYRNVVHLSLGGKAIRLRLSNEFGATSLRIASVHVARLATAGAIEPATDHAVTFNNSASITIPAGALVISDPIAMPVAAFSDLAVSIYVPAQPGATLTEHILAVSSNYTTPGNEVTAITLEHATRVTHWFLLKGVDVDAGSHASAVVTLGASITDGFHSTVDKNLRWPDDLAARLHANRATANVGVINEGISGNRLLHDITGPSALARLDRDVLAQSGARYIFIAIGTNDIGRTDFPERPNETVTAEQMDTGLEQIVLRAHARGIRVMASTLCPFGGAGYWTPVGEQMRLAYNHYILTARIFDGVIDFDSVTRDPARPDRLLPAFDSGDHLHPNDAGYKAMADSIDLKLFTK